MDDHEARREQDQWARQSGDALTIRELEAKLEAALLREEELRTLLSLTRSMILSGESMSKPVEARIEAAFAESREARGHSAQA